jgi:hypothetical protein
VSFGTVLLALAGYLVSAGYRTVSVWTLLPSGMCYAPALRIQLKKQGYTQRVANIWSTSLGLIIFVTSIVLLALGDQPITISPKSMAFTAQNAFNENGSALSFEEQYIFTVHNKTDHPLYNVWIEFKSYGLRLEDIEIKPKRKSDVSLFSPLGFRLDTSGLRMIDTRGRESILVTISQIAPEETYEYNVTMKDKSKCKQTSYLTASVLRISSNDAQPVRSHGGQVGGRIILPNSLPKSGKIYGLLFFKNE